MLQTAIKARLPLISVTTDDPVNAAEVLAEYAGGKKVHSFADMGEKSVIMSAVYWTYDEKQATIQNYWRYKKATASLVVFNPTKPNDLFYNAGAMAAPHNLVYDMLAFAPSGAREKLVQVLKGLSLKTAGEIVALTVARTGGALPAEVRKTRLQMTGGVQGLIPVETEEKIYYACPPQLRAWMDTNRKFFESPNTPHKLMPRGLVLDGPPGTGKTMAAREIAHEWGIPLYRLDISQALGRWIGESETRVNRGLALAEQEAPCVLLMDEVEKVFSQSEDTGTITRILSGLLWWLSEHRSRVITVMTTNNLSKIPAELHRAGRLDTVITLPRLSLHDAQMFSLEVFWDTTGKTVTMPIQSRLFEAVKATGKSEIAHAEVAQIVYDLIKHNAWIML